MSAIGIGIFVLVAAPVVDNLPDCLAPIDLEDRDGDVARNLEAFSEGDLCLRQHIFHEGQLRWVLQIIQNKRNPNTVFWIVPHDNEDDAFDSAVYGVKTYGGTVASVETGGKRYNGLQDPNRNFDAGTGIQCTKQTTPSPIYTANVMQWLPPNAPIIALHTNAGAISISRPSSGAIPFRAQTPIAASAADNTLVFVASTEHPNGDSALMQYVGTLNHNGMHVLYEIVSVERNDCSLSNYAALKRLGDYINIEVLQGDGITQRHMIDLALELLPRTSIAPLNTR